MNWPFDGAFNWSVAISFILYLLQYWRRANLTTILYHVFTLLKIKTGFHAKRKILIKASIHSLIQLHPLEMKFRNIKSHTITNSFRLQNTRYSSIHLSRIFDLRFTYTWILPSGIWIDCAKPKTRFIADPDGDISIIPTKYEEASALEYSRRGIFVLCVTCKYIEDINGRGLY